jgi:glycine cleavage system H protein
MIKFATSFARSNSCSVAPRNLFSQRKYFSTRFTKDHEWISVQGKTATIGITDFAQNALGDVVYVDLPAVGTQLSQKGAFAAIESVKVDIVKENFSHSIRQQVMYMHLQQEK